MTNYLYKVWPVQWQAILSITVAIVLYILGHYFPYNSMLGCFVLLVSLIIVYFGSVAVMNTWKEKCGEQYRKITPAELG